PHLFTKKQDIEIAGLFAAVFAWGNRTTIIGKSKELMQRMDNSPYAFVKEHLAKDLKKLKGFKHRTFTKMIFVTLLNSFISITQNMILWSLLFSPLPVLILNMV